MRRISLSDFLTQRRTMLAARGIEFTPAVVSSLRNNGERRTPEKREALKQIAQRRAQTRLPG